MNQEITNVKLNFHCNQDWDKMQNTSEGKFCTGCQKNVYDLTDKKVADFLKLLDKNNNSFCGRYKATQIAPNSKENVWRKWAIAAFVFIGMSPFLQKASAQTIKDKKRVAPPVNSDGNESFLMGEVAIAVMEPQAKAGINATHRYLAREFKGTPALSGSPTLMGSLMVSFNVDKNGKLFNIKTNNKFTDGVKENVSNEILSLLSKAPAWKDYKQTNDNINQLYSLMLSFKNGRIISLERM